MNCEFEDNIFDQHIPFEERALRLFAFQYMHNPVYRRYCELLNRSPQTVHDLESIPFLPISFFKTQMVATGDFKTETIFESSGTTGQSTSRHFVKSVDLYEQSFLNAFLHFYGRPEEWCILGLLPSYLERSNSSLVLMVEKLIRLSGHQDGGFYLNDQHALQKKLAALEDRQQKTLLIGVTFALLDFAEKYPLHLDNTVVMETGGMKGRREELTRDEVHELLKTGLGVHSVHSEYGMTELLSQAYSKGEGVFECPHWMRILAREEDDPLNVFQARESQVRGALNVIDLANIYSCAFIATDDRVILHPDLRFEVMGRLDYSDVRGCSQLAI